LGSESITSGATPGVPSIAEPPYTATSSHGAGTLTARRFIAPIVDDDATRSLQPFLQRASIVSVEASLGGFSESISVPPDATGRTIAVAAGADVYATRWLAFTASVGYASTVDDFDGGLRETFDTLPVEGGFALRFGDARFDLSWQPTFLLSPQPPTGGYGDIHLAADLVFERAVEVTLDGSIFHGGAAVNGEVAWYVTKGVGVFVGGLGSSGHYPQASLQEDKYEARAGATVWPIARVRLLAELDVTGRADRGAQFAPQSFFDCAGRLDALVRF
jgi:hypothetical protein